MSLVELIIAMSILSLAVVGFVSSFRYITRSIHVSRGRTLASNLAQEKIENMKDASYHKLQLSTETITNNDYSPPLIYDQNNYPPETITIGGLSFLRATFVAFAEVTNNEISTVTFNYPDTGLKQMRVYVMWTEGSNKKYLELQNIYENPDIDPLNTIIDGCVQTAANCGSGKGIASAIVEVMGTDWKDTADANGEFSISVHAGTYTLRASSAGFVSETKNYIGASTGTTTTVDPNFQLVRIPTGTITGRAWINNHLLISQVAVDTRVPMANLNNEDIEYIELFNPTTYTITIATTGSNTHEIDLDCESGASADRTHDAFGFIYYSSQVAPQHYYLMANATAFIVDGSLVHADASYGDHAGNVNYIKNTYACGLTLTRVADGVIQDRVGWNDVDDTAPVYEGSPIPNNTVTDHCCAVMGETCDGQGSGNFLIRISSPGSETDSYGPAYDTNDNSQDWMYHAIVCNNVPLITALNGKFGVGMPRATEYGPVPLMAGTPAHGALITSNDTIGPSTTTVETTVDFTFGTLTHSMAEFTLNGVATGTWSVLISTGETYTIISSVTVEGLDVSTNIPNFGTDPPTVSSEAAVILSSSSSEGYISGTVTDVDGNPLSLIKMNVGAQPKTTGTNGRYFAQVSSGTVTVVANEGNDNNLYVESIERVTVNTGQITTLNFSLSQGGILKGFLTTDGSSILPGVEVTAELSGAQYGSATSDDSGYFYIKNLATATYTVAPALDASEVSDPVSSTATVIVNETVFVGTFTIYGSLSDLTGTLTVDGSTLTSGALILASTNSISYPPDNIVGSSAPTKVFVYAASSKADGTYEMELRGGSTYNLSVFVPTIDASGTTVSVTTKTISNVFIDIGASDTLNITVP